MLYASLEEKTSVITALNNYIFSKNDQKNLLVRIGQAGVDTTHQRMQQEIAPDGTPWQKSQRVRQHGGQTLRDGSILYNSMHHEVVSSDTVRWGTGVRYAKPLHYGMRIQAKNFEFLHFKGAYGFVKVKSVELPARPMVGFSKQDEANVIDIVTSLLSQKIN